MFRNSFDLFDDFFNDMYGEPFTKKESAERKVPQLMRTDVLEKDGQYLLDIELPGYSRDEVEAELKDGYLTIAAMKQKTVENQDTKTNYIRKERYTGSMKRTFYVGEDVTEKDIQAAFKDGILKVMINKPKPKELTDERKFIPIL
ncbi:MAG: Hsp20/alpha crystallin family protein [Eubacteriales bacterium]|nr:Hsp20/alpha crystallin family protein [Eubacteriales bacterium]